MAQAIYGKGETEKMWREAAKEIWLRGSRGHVR
jgi:hypothetical protein